MIQKISGKSKSPSFTILNTNRGTKATSKEEIANTLGETFLDKSSSYAAFFIIYSKVNQVIYSSLPIYSSSFKALAFIVFF